MQRQVVFWLGVAIMIYETVIAHADRPWLIAAALGMLGLPVARSLESALSKMGQPPSKENGE